MTKDDVQMMGFQIIGVAGDAFDYFFEGARLYLTDEKEAAEESIKAGQALLAQVHTLQTKLIQAEANEEEVPYSLIMSHAQDHLTIAISWGRYCELLLQGGKVHA